jgi:glycosyltransferase involved in cell wall biosynthesis
VPGLSADKAIGVTDFVRRRFIENGRFPASRCRTVPNGVALTPLPVAAHRYAARDELQLDPDSVAVGVVSRAHRFKNWSFAIEVARSVSVSLGTRTSKVTWVFCGDGPDLAAFRQEADIAGVSDQCYFLGRREDVPRLLAGLDIGMHPSQGEVGYSLSILEFMRAGLPVVVPDLPSVCGATAHERTGLVYPAGNRTAAAAAICQLVHAPELRHRLGMAGRAEMESRYSLDTALDALIREVADFI